MSRTTFSLTCLLWLSWVGSVSAQPQSGAAALNDPGVASLQNFSGGVTFAGSYFQVQNLTGSGVGYQNGYTQLGHMMPFWVNDNFVIASNSRLLITDNSKVGGNIGAFMRYYDSDHDRIWGANGYYDIDQSIYGNQYRQGGFGIESLGQWLDFRANGYVPTQAGDHFIRALTLSDTLTYFGNRVGFLGTGQYEESLWGGDFEFGTPLTPYTPWLRGYAGMYAYHSKGTDPVGVRTRVEGWVADDLNIGVQYTNDKQFGSNVNASVNFLFSGWKPTRWFPNFATHDRMLIPVQRNWRIATGKYEQIDPVAAFNPRTNQPYFITWVDNSAVAPGDGTYEHPLTAMPPTAPNADLILVRVGNTSPLAPLVGNIALSDWQRMLGEGREHQFDAYAHYGALNVPLQTFNLPQFTNTGLYPFLSSVGNTITLANNNEVSAFNIINALGIGIANTPAGSNNFNLNYLNLQGNLGGGILLQQASGDGFINHIVAQDNLGGGIGVNSGADPLFLTMDTVISNSSFPGAQLFGVSINANNAPVFANLTDVTANGNLGGILMSETNSGLEATLRNVNAIGNVGPLADGIRAAGTGGYMVLDYQDVVATGNGRNGFRITGANTDIQFLGANINGNSNVGDNLNITLTAGSTFAGSLTDSSFDDSALGGGIVLSATSSAIGGIGSPFLIENVTGSGNFLDGLSVTEAGNAFVNLFVDPSHFDNNSRDGFHFNVQGGSVLAALFDQDTLNDNGRSAIFGNVDLAGSGSSLVLLTLTDTPGVRSGADGLFIQSANGAEIHVTGTNEDFSDSGQTTADSSAVRFDADASNVFLTLNNFFGRNSNGYPSGTEAFGLQLNLTNGTQFLGNLTDGDFSNNLQQGILIDASGNGSGFVNLDNVAVNGNGADGLKASASNGYSFAINAIGTTSFSNNGLDAGAASGNGINLTVDGTAAASSLLVSLDATSVNNNRDNGIVGTVAGTALIPGVITLDTSDQTSIDNNGLDGVSLINNSGIVLANFVDTDISFNGGNGVSYVGTGLGANLSSITFSHAGINGFFGTTDSNGGDGLNFQVLAGNTLSLSADSVSFSSNSGAGINGLIDGAGSDVYINSLLQVTAENNFREGLNLLVDNSGVLNASVNGGSFSFNGISGVFDGVHVVTDHNAIATICFDGTVVNSNTGNGFEFNGHNNSQLYVALITSGTYGTLSASDNGGQPVVFTLDSGASGGLFMEGANNFTNSTTGNGFTFTAVGSNRAIFEFSGNADNNAGDGLHVEMTNVAEAYIDIHDGSASNNGDNGIDIALDNVTFGAAPISVNFLQGTITANPFNISNMIVDNNGSTGIQIIGTAVTMPVGTITGNEVTGSGGDGILINLSGGSNIGTLTLDQNTADQSAGNGISIIAANSSFNTLTISNGGMRENNGHGLNIDLTNTPIDTLNITGNQQSQNALVGLGFQIIGDTNTQPFEITNTSTAGFDITGFQLDITPSGHLWDTVEPQGSQAFAPQNGTDLITGLQTVNGNPWPNAIPGGGVPDNQGLIDLTFNDFNPGENFQWLTDADPLSGTAAVFGNELVGSTITVDFTGGLSLTGTLQPLGVDGSQFVATGGNLLPSGISGNGGDGIHLIQLNSPINNLNISDNSVTSNTGDGLHIQQTSSNVVNTLIDGNTFDGNGARGINHIVNNSTLTNLTVSNNSASTNTTEGMVLTATNSSMTTVSFNGNTADTNGGDGLRLAMTNTPITTLNILNNGIHANNGNGVNLDLNGSPIGTLNASGNDIAGGTPLPLLGFTVTDTNEHWSHQNLSENGIFIQNIHYDFSPIGWSVATTRGAGSDFELIAGAVQAGITTVNGNPVNTSQVAQPGVIADGSPTVDMNFTSFDNTVPVFHVDFVVGDASASSIQTGADLGGSTYSVTFSDGETLNGVFNNTNTQTLIRPAAAGAGNTGDGIRISQVNSSIGSLTFDSNNISGNGGHGIDFATVTNSNIGSTTVSNNTINNNDGDGFHLIDPATINNNLNFTFTDNTISGNGANGPFLGNGVNGVNFQMNNAQTLNLTMTGNTINDNLNSGVRTVMSGTSVLNANIGSSAANHNTFSGNGDAGMSVVMSNNTTGVLNVANTSFDNSVVSSGGTFFGVGLGISLTDSAALSSINIGDSTANGVTFDGNASHGFQLITNSFASTGPISFQNFSASNNGGDGLNFDRSGSSTMGPVTIDTGTITGNAGNGIQATAADLDATDTYTITNSTITGNTSNGIRMNIIGDADLDVTISGNTISNNSVNGIFTTFNSDVTDTPTIILDINNNTINGNGTNGILILTPHFASIDTNTIANNGQDGINFGGSGVTAFFAADQITNNTITGNGDDGIDIGAAFLLANIDTNTISGNTDDGIVAEVSGGGAQQIVTINNNSIMTNGGDGIQISAHNGSGTLANPNSYAITNNDIVGNSRRGINVVNAGGTNGFGGTGLQRNVMDLTINDNYIARNMLEGVYIINTASNTQALAANINNLASAALLADGSVFAKPVLNLNMDNNFFDSNGQSHNAGNFIDATGFVLRVGTSDATDSIPSSYTSADTGGTANGGRGGVVATVTNNVFSGQYAADVTFQPFISTAAPNTTTGTWTDQNTAVRNPADDVFSVTSYVQDPLARLDLIFTNNTGNGLVASNVRASSAFYNNDEPEFKSRGVTGVSSDTAADGAPGFPAAPDDNGPFSSGARARNATRQTFRGALPPTIAAGSTFRYSGLGANDTPLSATNGSTFRLQTGNAGTNSFFIGGGTFSNSVFIGGGFGEAPFVWGSF